MLNSPHLSLGYEEVLDRGPPTFGGTYDQGKKGEEKKSQYENIQLSHMPVGMPALAVITVFWTLMRHCLGPVQFGLT